MTKNRKKRMKRRKKKMGNPYQITKRSDPVAQYTFRYPHLSTTLKTMTKQSYKQTIRNACRVTVSQSLLSSVCDSVRCHLTGFNRCRLLCYVISSSTSRSYSRLLNITRAVTCDQTHIDLCIGICLNVS